MIQDQLGLEKLQAFLKQNHLPYQDVKLEGNLYFSYHDNEHNMIGSGGLEIFGKDALLRSLAVEETHRGTALGTKLVDKLIAKAKSLEIENLFLLTETASAFFEKRGFQTIDRAEVPDAVQNSTEFSSVCPASAACMVYKVSI